MNIMAKIRKALKKISIVAIREYRESKRMMQIFIHERQNKELLKEANRQLVDIFKILMLFPISLLPGSVVIVTLLELIAKAFGGTIFPKKQKL
ncbi:MAG: hypothetical protein C6H99_00520 [Epsilonproteobacteria bacterium]|nr:hypothetical protein [Campylobacterota bacterium]